MSLSRRHLLGTTGAGFTAGFSGLARAMSARAPVEETASPFGALRPDPNGVFDLPDGFSYTVIGQTGETMADGLKRPGDPDGMAAFAANPAQPGNGQVVLMVNHENGDDDFDIGPGDRSDAAMRALPKSKFYDYGYGKPLPGGVSALLFDENARATVRQELRLAGTVDNCAGGPTPWGSWITCEEDIATKDSGLLSKMYEQDHGYVFDVPAAVPGTYQGGLIDPVPLKAMGRFNHEAVAVDPATGIVYLTEDRDDGLLYRFLPDVPGKLAEGGRLQALAVMDLPHTDLRNWDGPTLMPGDTFAATWVDLTDVESPNDDLRYQGADKEAAIFARGEGVWYAAPEPGEERSRIYFACTSGGRKKLGQIWCYSPSPLEGTADEIRDPGTVTLFIESDRASAMNMCDNLTVSPFDHLFICEDSPGDCGVIGATPQGALYTFGRNMYSGSEIAGACFSPSGKTLFINIQKDGLTLAIQGPWDKVDKAAKAAAS